VHRVVGQAVAVGCAGVAVCLLGGARLGKAEHGQLLGETVDMTLRLGFEDVLELDLLFLELAWSAMRTEDEEEWGRVTFSSLRERTLMMRSSSAS
jgi:hypothetical protein